MPFKSQAQRGKFYAMAERGEISHATVKKWENHTPKGKKLPEHAAKKEAMAKVASALSKLPSETREKLAHRLYEYMSRPAGAQAVVHTKLAAYLERCETEKEAFVGPLMARAGAMATKYVPKLWGGVKSLFQRTPMSSNRFTHETSGGTIPAWEGTKSMGMQMAPWMALSYLTGGSGQQTPQQSPQQSPQSYY